MPRAIPMRLCEAGGTVPAPTVRDRCGDGYGALFSASVRAGLLDSHRLAGYRNGPVYIRGSRHVPPPASAVNDAMEALFDCNQLDEVALLGVREFVSVLFNLGHEKIGVASSGRL